MTEDDYATLEQALEHFGENMRPRDEIRVVRLFTACIARAKFAERAVEALRDCWHYGAADLGSPALCGDCWKEVGSEHDANCQRAAVLRDWDAMQKDGGR